MRDHGSYTSLLTSADHALSSLWGSKPEKNARETIQRMDNTYIIFKRQTLLRSNHSDAMLRTMLSEYIPRCHDKTQPVEPVEVVRSETENKCDLTFIDPNEWVAAARYKQQGNKSKKCHLSIKKLEQVLGATTLLNKGCLLISCPSTYRIPSTWVIPLHQVGKGLTSDEAEALKVYLERFGDCRDGSNPGADCRVYFWKAFLRCAESQFVLALLDAIHRIISHATWDTARDWYRLQPEGVPMVHCPGQATRKGDINI